MISLTCKNCQMVLEMDDAFAGGVCRCRHCGAIQTVPSHLKDKPQDAKDWSSNRMIVLIILAASLLIGIALAVWLAS